MPEPVLTDGLTSEFKCVFKMNVLDVDRKVEDVEYLHVLFARQGRQRQARLPSEAAHQGKRGARKIRQVLVSLVGRHAQSCEFLHTRPQGRGFLTADQYPL